MDGTRPNENKPTRQALLLFTLIPPWLQKYPHADPTLTPRHAWQIGSLAQICLGWARGGICKSWGANVTDEMR
jgi:hypothetical protein